MHAYKQPDTFPTSVLKALRLMVEDKWQASPVPMASGVAFKIMPPKDDPALKTSEILIAPNHVRVLISQGVVKQTTAGIVVDGDTQSFLKRVSLSALPIDGFLNQHLHLAPALEGMRPAGTKTQMNEHDKQAFTKDTAINSKESPLQWLASRNEKNGGAFLEPHQLQAGERLREDFTFGQLMPSMSINWSLAAFAGVSTSATNNDAAWTEATLAARQRFNVALKAVGGDFSGILVDVCCFLKPIGQIETERQWPARSAKLIIKFALNALAIHYGFSSEIKSAPKKERAKIRVKQ